MYFIFNGNTVNPKLGVVGVQENVITALENTDIDLISYDTANRDTVVQDNLDGLLQMNDQSYKLILQNNDPTSTKGLQMKVNQVVSTQIQVSQMSKTEVNSKAPQAQMVNTEYVYGSSETSIFDVFSPILIGFFIFFFVFLISGIGLLRERTTGTLERLMSTPIKRSEIVIGYLIGYGIFAVVQTLVIIFFSIKILDIALIGSIWYVMLINFLSAMVALSLGILLSTFASSEFQMIQFIPIVIIPQVFFSGIFPMDGMATWLQALSKIMPMYYAADALKGVMYKGYGFNEIRLNLGILTLFALVFIGLNIVALKKYRKL
jgi:ABC-2 type transport system permease protein